MLHNEKDDPTRAKDLNETVDPKFEKSNTDTDEPSRPMP
jgi:hypothetical protein